MDPNELVRRMLKRAERMQKDYEDDAGNGIDQDDAAELATDVLNLHGWLSAGGFLPSVWSK